MTANQQQLDLSPDTQSDLVYADLCNALYERELKKLAVDQTLPHAFLLKRIGSLPYYIKRASERIIEFYSPLDLDSQNAAWIYRQPKECPAPKQVDSDIEKFYVNKPSTTLVALIVPIYRVHVGEEVITLDTIDGVRDERIHTNENGWFGIDGEPQDEDNQQQRVLKPLKVSMTSACSGHKWLNHKRSGSRILSLREMLLATNINWKNLAKVMQK
ncbi:MAG: hypothetical protein MJK04_22755 [Psychrosphaera sp.]|nr:hypothetical protein [Psychrosphaera sp.]